LYFSTFLGGNTKLSIALFFIFWGAAIALFKYVPLRAYSIGFTHDESLAFMIISGEKKGILTANNHWQLQSKSIEACPCI
jgi:hypothetical protein